MTLGSRLQTLDLPRSLTRRPVWIWRLVHHSIWLRSLLCTRNITKKSMFGVSAWSRTNYSAVRRHSTQRIWTESIKISVIRKLLLAAGVGATYPKMQSTSSSCVLIRTSTKGHRSRSSSTIHGSVRFLKSAPRTRKPNSTSRATSYSIKSAVIFRRLFLACSRDSVHRKKSLTKYRKNSSASIKTGTGR